MVNCTDELNVDAADRTHDKKTAVSTAIVSYNLCNITSVVMMMTMKQICIAHRHKHI